MSRRKRESVIVQSMIRMYCKSIHKSEGTLCEQCSALSVYAEKRLLACMYGEIKPVCKNCPVHCYSPGMRLQMSKVMRWAGPRMIFRNPFFAISHFFDGLKASKQEKKNNSKPAGNK